MCWRARAFAILVCVAVFTSVFVQGERAGYCCVVIEWVLHCSKEASIAISATDVWKLQYCF